ncbi:CgeB family protein [Desulfovibrio inopinatus]|uniref:CgeB family protein n=1 Tax=Desulfovibrio inopinatus TaxID=102109 RepID=UPI00041DB96D|nr:glycosyltransferase [Desulfovibrio inopinatus]
MSDDFSYTAIPVFHDTSPYELVDIRLVIDGRTRHLGGRHAAQREVSQVDSAAQSAYPIILLGSGLGHGMAHLLKTKPDRLIIVVDRETPILDLTGARRLKANNLIWIDDPDPFQAATLVRDTLGSALDRAHIIAQPAWLRLRPEYYPTVHHLLQAPAPSSLFQQVMNYPRFVGSYPKTLMIRSGYFLENEIERALARLGAPVVSVDLADRRTGSTAFVEALLETVAGFKPDFVLTINHIGVDPHGKLLDLLHRFRLPLASWFVDSPRLILHEHTELAQDATAIFTWDSDTLPWLEAKGFSRSVYLPLATDTTRFTPGPASPPPHPFATAVSFVGASMLSQAQDPLTDLCNQPNLAAHIQRVATCFAKSPAHDVPGILKTHFPDLFHQFNNATSRERLAFELAVTWNATRDYRLNCIWALLPFHPLIVGDAGWQELLPTRPRWHHHGPIDYYTELPELYRSSTINFNCTSLQMKNAVNQRVFDVPACGGCLLTDYRQQITRLFDPETELFLYTTPEEAAAKVKEMLHDKERREHIVKNARQRVLHEHDYTHRMIQLLQTMQRWFG